MRNHKSKNTICVIHNKRHVTIYRSHFKQHHINLNTIQEMFTLSRVSHGDVSHVTNSTRQVTSYRW